MIFGERKLINVKATLTSLTKTGYPDFNSYIATGQVIMSYFAASFIKLVNVVINKKTGVVCIGAT